MLLCTVEPPNKGHVGDNINSAVLSFIERLSSFRGSQMSYRENNFGTSNSVLCREVYYIVSLFWRVHYQRLHCIYTHSPCTCTCTCTFGDEGCLGYCIILVDISRILKVKNFWNASKICFESTVSGCPRQRTVPSMSDPP